MDWAALFALIKSWGPSAISSVLVIVVLHLIKKVDANGSEEKERAASLKNYLEAKVKELREDVYKALEDHGRKISYIEHEYVKRESFYRELGGWKSDINRLSEQVPRQLSEFYQNIIELWKSGR